MGKRIGFQSKGNKESLYKTFLLVKLNKYPTYFMCKNIRRSPPVKGAIFAGDFLNIKGSITF